MKHQTTTRNTTRLPQDAAEEVVAGTEEGADARGLDVTSTQLDYENTVLMLGTTGRLDEALSLLRRFGPTHASLQISAPDDVRLHIETLVWPGDVALHGNFDIDALIVGGELSVDGQCVTRYRSVAGRVIDLAPAEAHMTGPRPRFSPIVIDPATLPRLAVA